MSERIRDGIREDALQSLCALYTYTNRLLNILNIEHVIRNQTACTIKERQERVSDRLSPTLNPILTDVRSLALRPEAQAQSQGKTTGVLLCSLYYQERSASICCCLCLCSCRLLLLSALLLLCRASFLSHPVSLTVNQASREQPLNRRTMIQSLTDTLYLYACEEGHGKGLGSS